MHEECGVFGIFGHEGAAADVLTGLRFLQHRVQEGCGVACVDEAGRRAELCVACFSGLYPTALYAHAKD